MRYLAAIAGACLLAGAGGAFAQDSAADIAASTYAPTVEDWIGVNAAVNNYTLGLELHEPARYDLAFWPEATIIVEPEPGMRMTMPYRQAAGPPPGAPPPGAMPPGAPPVGGPPPGAPPSGNAIGSDIPPWHLALSHHFEFQSATRATHYGYFVSVYPDLTTKVSTVGLPGHYEDILEKRGDEWRILQRITVIGAK